MTEAVRMTGICAAAFVLDLLFGDPAWLYHPIRIIGNLIAFLEKFLRRFCGESDGEGARRRLLAAGGVLWVIVAGLSFFVPYVILKAAWKVHPALWSALEIFWCWQILAAKSLAGESRKVWEKVRENDLEGARRAVSMIVGRDTQALSLEGVTKAAVETVAENTSDGVTVPLLFLLIGGAPAGFLYKAVNTMDSMLGYKNEKYLYFGRIPAKMDDLFNYIPSRITALLMVVSAWIGGLDGRGAWRIFRRDRRKHASPNSAQGEAACAGALGVQLAGDAVYFGKVYHKEYIGDPNRPIEADDILRAHRLMYLSAWLMLVLGSGVRILLAAACVWIR